MSRLSRAFIVLAAAIALGLWVSPATASKATLSDEELDTVAASATPTILQAGNTSSIDFTDDTLYTLDFDVPNAQTGIRALTIQNIVGEQQLLINLNVLSAVQNVAGTDQRNFSLQSWGGTNPVPGTGGIVQGVVGAPCTGDNSCVNTGSGGGNGGAAGNGGNALITVTNGSNAGNASGGAGGAAGAGGAGATITAGDAASAPPAVLPTASASGDLIAVAGDSSSIKVTRDPLYTLAFTASQAQSDLAALFVSNVVGESQMALNLNIASATLNLVPEPNTPFTTGLQNTGPGVIKQVNMGLQFRGTPLAGSSGTMTNFNLSISAENK